MAKLASCDPRLLTDPMMVASLRAGALTLSARFERGDCVGGSVDLETGVVDCARMKCPF